MASQVIINYEKKLDDGQVYSGQVTMNFPDDIHEMIQMWGEAVAYQKAKAQIVIDARRLCYDSDTPEQAQEAVSAWVPGVSKTRAVSGISNKALLEFIKGLSPEEKKGIMERLNAK